LDPVATAPGSVLVDPRLEEELHAKNFFRGHPLSGP